MVLAKWSTRTPPAEACFGVTADADSDLHLLCYLCDGTGQRFYVDCTQCHGTGRITQEEWEAEQRQAAEERAYEAGLDDDGDAVPR